LLWICRKAVDLLWICRKVVDLLWICRKVVDLSKSRRKVVDLLWICCTACCTANPQQIEQVEFELNTTTDSGPINGLSVGQSARVNTTL
jgi:hypothetical protein